jgi:hypothetical protein
MTADHNKMTTVVITVTKPSQLTMFDEEESKRRRDDGIALVADNGAGWHDRAMYVIWHLPIGAGYIGASSIGSACDRRIWNQFHWVDAEKMSAKSIKAIADGHHSEELMAEPLTAGGWHRRCIRIRKTVSSLGLKTATFAAIWTASSSG